MQVFVPSPDFAESARALDDRRLFKQLVEVYQLLMTILGLPKLDGTPRKGWLNHPATVQWRDHPGALKRYALAVAKECKDRGQNAAGLESKIVALPVRDDGTNPPWLGDDTLHSSHRARLLQKDFNYYRRHDWPEADDPNLAARRYFWAVPQGSTYKLVAGPEPKTP